MLAGVCGLESNTIHSVTFFSRFSIMRNERDLSVIQKTSWSYVCSVINSWFFYSKRDLTLSCTRCGFCSDVKIQILVSHCCFFPLTSLTSGFCLWAYTRSSSHLPTSQKIKHSSVYMSIHFKFKFYFLSHCFGQNYNYFWRGWKNYSA
jgi:hypothetical protein